MVEHHDVCETLEVYAETNSEIGCHAEAYVLRLAAREIRKLREEIAALRPQASKPPLGAWDDDVDPRAVRPARISKRRK
jgi:hypothetical protein